MLRNARVKICIVNPYEHGGGAEYQISLLIDALADSGEYDIHYLTHFVDERDRSRRYQVWRIGGGSIARFGYITEARSLYRVLSKIAPDVLYQRVACAYTGVCALYARRRGVPLVWHVSHDTEVTPQHLDQARNVIRLQLEKWAVEFGIRNATRIVVQTQHQAGLLQTNYARIADAVIPNFHGLATEQIDKSGPLNIVWIANLKPWKQPAVFVRLASSLSSYTGVRFIMVGAAAAGRQPWQDALMRSIDGADNLQYVGHKSQAEVNELLARAHIFVNTSVHEGFPNTFIQSWLREVAVVSLRVDPDRVLERQRVGIVAKSEAGLVAAVRDLIEQPEMRAAYASRGRDYARSHHSMQNAEELIRLIRRHGGAGTC